MAGKSTHKWFGEHSLELGGIESFFSTLFLSYEDGPLPSGFDGSVDEINELESLYNECLWNEGRCDAIRI